MNQLSLAPAVSLVCFCGAISVTTGPDRLSLNLDMSCGTAAITAPYLAMLSCSSKRGTASSFKFLGTCNEAAGMS